MDVKLDTEYPLLEFLALIPEKFALSYNGTTNDMAREYFESHIYRKDHYSIILPRDGSWVAVLNVHRLMYYESKATKETLKYVEEIISTKIDYKILAYDINMNVSLFLIIDDTFHKLIGKYTSLPVVLNTEVKRGRMIDSEYEILQNTLVIVFSNETLLRIYLEDKSVNKSFTNIIINDPSPPVPLYPPGYRDVGGYIRGGGNFIKIVRATAYPTDKYRLADKAKISPYKK